MAAPNHSVDRTFDPYSQEFVILAPDGKTQVSVSMSDILALQENLTIQGIIYGMQIGLCVLLLTVLVLMTKSDKRRSAVFLLNTAVLSLLLLRSIVDCIELRSMFCNFYNWELEWYPDSPSLHRSTAASITAEVLSSIADIVIYASLILQLHIVCCTLSRFQRNAIILGGAFAGLVAISVRLTLAAMNIKWFILDLVTMESPRWQVFQRLGSAANIITVVIIALFSCVFLVKLAFAIKLRRKLNMKQFGPMQIIFVMGCQTLFVPRTLELPSLPVKQS